MLLQPRRAFVDALMLTLMVALVSCERNGTDPPTTFRFIDHVQTASSTSVRAELPALHEGGHQAGPVTLRGETRVSLLSPPTSTSFTLDVSDNSVLRFGIAAATLTNPEYRTPIDFIIRVTQGDDEEILFRESIARSERNRWHDREVDLTALAGASVRITFATEVPGDETGLFPLWANPVIAPAGDVGGAPKLILISIDCLRADHVGAYGYPRDTTPRVDRFAEESLVFETAIATSATTLPTHTSMFTGFTPSEHGASNRHMLNRSVPYLPELLAEAGFQVDGVVSGAYLAQNFGFERGFHSYRSLTRPRAVETVDAALSILDRAQGQSHFLFLHIIDAHWPYEPPEELEERFGPIQVDVPSMLQKVLKQIPPDSPAEIQQAIDLYDAEIAYADQELGRFFDELEARGLYDDAFIILTADHGEAFYEHDNWQHGWTLYDEIVHVPLVIKWPEGVERGRIGAQVSQADIFPTLLAYAGVNPPHTRAMDLTQFAEGSQPEQPRRYAYSEFTSNPAPGELPIKHVSIRSGTLKYITTFRTDGDAELSIVERITEEIYDLTKDPDETNNLVEASPNELAGFRNGLDAYLDEARVFRDWRQGDDVIEDDAIRDRLRALGYIQ